ncbi:MAG: cation transporter [Prevotella sp.]|nr:cation transporter [Prevotella sp.]
MKKNILLMVALLLSTAAIAKNLKTVVFTTLPQMHCENCEQKIKKNIRFVKGVKEIKTDISQQTVTITYDADKTNPEAIIEGFQRINYDARQLESGETVKQDAEEQCDNM